MLGLGLDIGTSGVRAAVVDNDRKVIAKANVPYPADYNPAQENQNPQIWWASVRSCLAELKIVSSEYKFSMSDISTISVCGTSGTIMPIDHNKNPLGDALMYFSIANPDDATAIGKLAGKDNPANAPTSTLARCMHFIERFDKDQIAGFSHQADYIAMKLGMASGISDEHNCLKLGYDVVGQQWPDWIGQLLPTDMLPEVLEPGTPAGVCNEDSCREFGFSQNTRICAGTTDSIAAFIAASDGTRGQGVSSLGSTLAIKLLGDQPIFDSAGGVYSHRFGGRWLVGGSSNSGGAALLRHFSIDEMDKLSAHIKPDEMTEFDYYPLAGTGERFPVQDKNMISKTTPRPEADYLFLQGLFEGIARIEHRGYKLLTELGAPEITQIVTMGGGANNDAWMRIRRNILDVEMLKAKHNQAAVGAAFLALFGCL